jgi:hypothetical protein
MRSPIYNRYSLDLNRMMNEWEIFVWRNTQHVNYSYGQCQGLQVM